MANDPTTPALPSWEVWANAPESVKAEIARVMADAWKCPASFARHHIDVDRENDRLRAGIERVGLPPRHRVLNDGPGREVLVDDDYEGAPVFESRVDAILFAWANYEPEESTDAD